MYTVAITRYYWLSSDDGDCFYRTLASSGKDLKDPFLKALAQREESNRSGKMTVSCD